MPPQCFASGWGFVVKSIGVWGVFALLAAAVAAAGGALALFYYQNSAYDVSQTLPGLFVALHP